MIRNIVFDMGKVMIQFDPDRFMDRAGIKDPADRKLIMNELFRSVEWAQMDEGTLTEETAEPLILTRIPERLKATVSSLLYNWAFPREQIPGMEDLVRRLKETGYGIWLLSNASKMQPRYWRIFTERFSLKPEECLFIDDAPANVAGAIACGWQGIVFHGDAEELERKMIDAGINIPR